MRSFSALTVFLCFLKISTISGSSVLPPSLTVASGEGFLIRLDLYGDVPLQNCQLTRNNKLYLLVPGQSQSHELITGEVVLPFDYNNTYECGVRVSNANVASQGVWKLTSIDENGTEMNGSCSVTVAPTDSSCPSQSTNCEIIDLITAQNGSCDSDFTDHHPNYECLFWGAGQMSQKQITNQADDPKALDSYRVTNLGDTILECELSSITECFVEHVASQVKYSVQEGLQHTRYSAYKSNFLQGLCEFEIPREVNEDEVGIWMMTVYGERDEANPFYGQYHNGHYHQSRFIKVPISKTCKFQLTGNVTLGKERIIARTRSTVVVKTTKDTAKIDCAKNVFYPIEVCYLVNGTELTFSQDRHGMADGRCELEVAPGNWTCGFNGPSEEDKDFVQKFQVIKYDTEIIDETVEVDANGSTTMECHLVDRLPIQMCIFVAPSGAVYRPPSDTFKSEEFSFYDGGRMSTGDCGITFAKGVNVEYGDWKCIILKSNNVPLTAVIRHEKPEVKKEQKDVVL